MGLKWKIKFSLVKVGNRHPYSRERGTPEKNSLKITANRDCNDKEDIGIAKVTRKGKRCSESTQDISRT